MKRLELFALGPPRIRFDGRTVEIERRKAIALLVYLAATGQQQSRDALAALLWPERDRSSARAALRRALWELNNALGKSWLEVGRDAISMKPAVGFQFDLDEFRRRLARFRSHNHSEELCNACRQDLAEAAGLYQDDFLSGFALRDSRVFDEWQFFQCEQLRRDFAGILEALVRHHGALGDFEPAIEYARRWLQLDPLHEPAHRHLIQLYSWSGQRAAAMRQYAECLRILGEELGITPQETTTQLYAAIKRAPQRVAYLRLISGPGAPAGERFVLGEATTLGYGRGANDIHLEDAYVSKRHARVEHRDGQYLLRDLNSTNGTLVRGVRIEPDKPRLLAAGDEIEIGETRLVFEYAETRPLGGANAAHETLRM